MSGLNNVSTVWGVYCNINITLKVQRTRIPVHAGFCIAIPFDSPSGHINKVLIRPAHEPSVGISVQDYAENCEFRIKLKHRARLIEHAYTEIGTVITI